MANTLRDGLEGHWSLDEAAAAVRLDSTPNENDAVPNASTESFAGVIGNAVHAGFGGSTFKYLTVPNDPALVFGDEDFTIAGFMYIESVAVNTAIGGLWNAPVNRRSYSLLFVQAGDGLQFAVSSDGTAAAGKQTLVVAPFNTSQVFAHFAAIHDAANNQIRCHVTPITESEVAAAVSAAHVDGVLENTTDTFDIGRFRGSTTIVGNGRIDELAIWRRALALNDLNDHFNGGAGLPFDQWEATPTAPGNFTAVAVGPDLIRLTWDDVPDNEDSFELQRRGPLSAGIFETRYVLPPATLTVLDGDRLVHETEYCYRIRAIVGGIPSDWSPTVCATTLAIPNPTVPVEPAVTTVQPSTWGALFHASPQPQQLDLDRQELIGRGFTLLDERAFAGRTELFGFGGVDALNSVLQDSDFRVRIPSYFFLLPVGEALTLDLIQKWAEFEDIVVQ